MHSALRWMASNWSDCWTVSPVCHTWHAYSRTGRTRDVYVFTISSDSSPALFSIRRKYRR